MLKFVGWHHDRKLHEQTHFSIVHVVDLAPENIAGP